MFNKLKQFKDLRSQAKSLQEALAQEKVEIERNGIKLVMDGNQKVVSLEINPELSTGQIQQEMPEIFNDAIKKVQRLVVEKMQSSGGLSGMGLPL
jgi:DNA-binding protein YbaB